MMVGDIFIFRKKVAANDGIDSIAVTIQIFSCDT